ncbi:MAG: hypothetical protein HY535_04355 [Chloroflexi bacterium]|nr:hypothetical protein [Chloroflexota bacterium]
MPQRPIPGYWKERCVALFAQAEQRGERLSDGVVFETLKAEARELEAHPDPQNRVLAAWVPSKRSISRIRTGEFAQIEEGEKALYRTFHWPESMERGDLPWEASAAALELLVFLDQQKDTVAQRPPIRLARWFWRVSQASPGQPIRYRVLQALTLAVNELRGGEHVQTVRGVEWELAYRPWHNAVQGKAYYKARHRPQHPIPSGGLFPWNEEALHAEVAWVLGGLNLKRMGSFIQAMLSDDVARKRGTKEEGNG